MSRQIEYLSVVCVIDPNDRYVLRVDSARARALVADRIADPVVEGRKVRQVRLRPEQNLRRMSSHPTESGLIYTRAEQYAGRPVHRFTYIDPVDMPLFRAALFDNLVTA